MIRRIVAIAAVSILAGCVAPKAPEPRDPPIYTPSTRPVYPIPT